MMFSILGLVVALCSILFAAAVCIQVAKGRLLLKYSLLWLGLALVAQSRIHIYQPTIPRHQ